MSGYLLTFTAVDAAVMTDEDFDEVWSALGIIARKRGWAVIDWLWPSKIGKAGPDAPVELVRRLLP